MQVGAAEIAAGGTGDAVVERTRVVGVPGVAQVDRPEAREGLAGAARPRRQHAVEHVDAARHRAQQILRLANAHQVARPIRRQQRHGDVEHAEHRLPGPRRPPGRRRRSRRSRCRSAPPPTPRAARGARRPARCRTGRSPAAATKASRQRAAQRIDRRIDAAAASSRFAEARAFVEHHGDVGVEQALDLDGARRASAGAGCRRYGCGSRRRPRRCVRSPASDITWKPPESVRIGPGQLMKACRPPSRATRSAPGRSIRW